MFKDTPAFSGFSVDNIDKARQFYGEVLGLQTEINEMGFLNIKLATGATILAYSKPGHQPADYTILNFPVSDIDEAAQALTAQGVSLEHYQGLTDDTGIARGLAAKRGPDIAWFKDPAGNILSILNDGR